MVSTLRQQLEDSNLSVVFLPVNVSVCSCELVFVRVCVYVHVCIHVYNLKPDE